MNLPHRKGQSPTSPFEKGQSPISPLGKGGFNEKLKVKGQKLEIHITIVFEFV
jgi:hypothetical protein